MLALVRYIHLNPLRAGIVEDIGKLHRYLYGGHSALLHRFNTNWQDTDYVLKFLGDTVSTARRHYRKFIRKAVSHGRKPELTGFIKLRGYIKLAKNRLAETTLTPLVKLSTPSCLTT